MGDAGPRLLGDARGQLEGGGEGGAVGDETGDEAGPLGLGGGDPRPVRIGRGPGSGRRSGAGGRAAVDQGDAPAALEAAEPALSPATRRSHQAASSIPPATHQPSTAAITGLDSGSRVGPERARRPRAGAGPSGRRRRRRPSRRRSGRRPGGPGPRRRRSSSSWRRSAVALSMALRRSGRPMRTTVTPGGFSLTPGPYEPRTFSASPRYAMSGARSSGVRRGWGRGGGPGRRWRPWPRSASRRRGPWRCGRE